MSFAAALARAQAATTRHLANATMTHAGGALPVIFRQQDEQRDDSHARAGLAKSPRLWLAEAAAVDFVGGVPERGASVSIDGVAWRVGSVDVDVSGWAMLWLNRA